MAIIYQKAITGGYDQCLILDRFEGVQYEIPKEVQNWTEIRIGLLLSCTTEISNNGLYSVPTYTSNSVFTPTNTVWMGLKTNNNIFPGVDGAAFLGIGTNNGQVSLHRTLASPNPICFDVAQHSDYTHGNIPFIMGSGDVTNQSYKFNNSYDYNTTSYKGYGLLPEPRYCTGTAAPIQQFGMRFIKQSGCAIQWEYKRVGLSFNTYSVSDGSTEGLKNFISIFNYSDSNIYQKNALTTVSISADPFTSNGTMSGTPIPTPDSFFIYWPIPNTRLRIHNFIIEKYA